MANVKTILDTRRAKSDGTFNIIFRITHFKKVYTINSDVAIHEFHWDSKNHAIIKEHPNSRLLNIKLLKEFFKIQQTVLSLDDDFTIEKFRNLVNGESGKARVMFKEFAQKLILKMFETNSTGNAIVYRTAVNRFINFCGKDIPIDTIDYELLNKFNHHLIISGLKQNSISNYFRTIRAIYNKAIKQKVIERSYYPFFDITIKSERTSKRAISKDDLIKLKLVPLEEYSTAWRAFNYFMLSFYLRGISFTDLAYLKASNIMDGRIHYKRRKTHKNYSIKLFSPAEALFNKLKSDNNGYLLPVLPNDSIEDSLEAKKIIKQWIKTTNKYLKRLSDQINCKISITTYSSRHGFATIAKRLGYSNELIAEALGHEYGNKITNIYLDAFDTDVLDDMHYKVVS